MSNTPKFIVIQNRSTEQTITTRAGVFSPGATLSVPEEEAELLLALSPGGNKKFPNLYQVTSAHEDPTQGKLLASEQRVVALQEEIRALKAQQGAQVIKAKIEKRVKTEVKAPADEFEAASTPVE